MAIQQHPLPQDISSYRFRLIGDMTLKQFASVGVCIVLALIFYGLPLPFFFKYPIVFAFLLLGVGMAFIPVQGRSLDVWLIAFIKSIYSPTQYIWKRSPVTTTESTETAVPSKENNLAVTRPVSNPSIASTSSVTHAATPQPSLVSVPSTSPAVTSTSTTISTPSTIVTTPTLPASAPVPQPIVPPTTPSPAPQTPVSAPTTAPTVTLPIPFTPSTPNTLVGLTLTPSGSILDGVLVEIKKDNLTLRATKSNKLGQFMFARPLESGLYQILAEKDGSTFTPYSLELSGNIVKPLKIQAQ